MNLNQILNKLYAGKKITLGFDSLDDRESFRTRIYKTKKQQDVAIEATLDEEKMILRTKQFVGESQFMLVLWTEEKKPVTYSVISIEDNGESSSSNEGSAGPGITDTEIAQKVSENLADSVKQPFGQKSKNKSREDSLDAKDQESGL